MKKKSIELLSPAKNLETGIAAINHGADAVYIGYNQFGAREAAGNELLDIEKLVSYAHLFHVKVYVTINTIIFENEITAAEKLIHKLYQIGADAIIIQDMGILEMDLPPIPIHASTQANNVDAKKVKFLEDIGIQRVILARELSVDEISSISKGTKIELEAFVHGALCVSYSGQCYFSQAITGRSANRGACAQPCRSSYDLVDEDGNVIVKSKHLLSLRDNNQTENIEALIDAGISSFKIEGRLKDLDYVKNITAHYRKILDSIIERRNDLKKSSSGKTKILFEPDPERTFNRGYTSYFAKGRIKNQSSFNTQKSVGKQLGNVNEVGENWFSLKTDEAIINGDGLCFFDKNDILTGIKVNRVEEERIFPLKMNGVYKNATVFRNFDKAFNQKLNSTTSIRQVDCEILVKVEESKCNISLTDEDGIETTHFFSYDFTKAKNPDAVSENIKNQLSKSGDSFLLVSNVSVEFQTADIPFFAISQINGWRRELFSLHEKARLKNHFRAEVKIVPNTIPFPENILDYKANIANPLAEKFYKRHGVEKMDKAFELKSNFSGEQLMVTRYCILHELGYCDGNRKNQLAGKKLLLRDNNRSYPLVFDCKKCQMKVLFPSTSK